MSEIQENINRVIEKHGFVTIEQFMDMALNKDAHSYYNSLADIGSYGDFLTAPEISQMFGETIALWVIEKWQLMGRPVSLSLIELGPGTGKMMFDILRTIDKIMPELCSKMQVYMYDLSNKLSLVQQKNLTSFKSQITWINNLADVKNNNVILLANEFFDALAVRQFQKISGLWKEVVITDIRSGIFGNIDIKYDDIITAELLASYINAPENAIVEYSPASIKFLDHTIKELNLAKTGAALIIDYGYDIAPEQRDNSQYISTLQALKKHKHCSIFEHIGRADITCHVDFSALKKIVSQYCDVCQINSQREFLKQYGIDFRYEQLYRSNPDDALILYKQLERLTSSQYMGTLFKVLEIIGR